MESCEGAWLLNAFLCAILIFKGNTPIYFARFADLFCVPIPRSSILWKQDPYCTQDLHAGQITTPTDDTWGLYFAGHHVLAATLDELDKAPYFLDKATDIIVSGASAGGIGVWMNVDFIAQRYPSAKVTAFTVAGHYFYANYYTGENATSSSGMADFTEEGIEKAYNLYDAFVDESCKVFFEEQGLSGAPCMLSNNSMPFIESEGFVVQAMTDQVVLTGHDNWPEEYMYEEAEQEYLMEWSTNMSVALQPLMAIAADGDTEAAVGPRHGVFAAACYTHGGFSHSYPLIDDMNFYTAFSNFYFSATDPSGYKLEDTCGVMCNPTCA